MINIGCLTSISYILDVPASAAYFGGYEILQRLMVAEGGDRNQLSIGKTLFAGGMAGIFNWMVALPPDVLKSRLQTGSKMKAISFFKGWKMIIQTLID